MQVSHIHGNFVSGMENIQSLFANASLSLRRTYMGIDSICFVIFSSFFKILDCEPVFELTDTLYFLMHSLRTHSRYKNLRASMFLSCELNYVSSSPLHLDLII